MEKIPGLNSLAPEGTFPTRSEKVPAGISGYSLHDEEREVPIAEPPPLLPNPELKYIGQSIERWDGHLKVTGRAKYTSDIQLPAMQYAKFANAAMPHAGIASIDVSVAQNHPGVTSNHRIHAGYLLDTATSRDPAMEVPSDWPVVRYAGQPIVSVAAVSPEIAEEAARLVLVQYAPLPFVVDMEAARKSQAPLVFPGAAGPATMPGNTAHPDTVPQTGNVRGPVTHLKGNIEQGFRDADVVLEGHFLTSALSHCALEPHSVIVDWKPDLMTVWTSTQDIARVREQFATFFQLPIAKVRVISEFTGGAFGGKFGAGNIGVCAAAVAKKSATPVSLALNRKEEHLSAGNIPGSDQYLQIGAKQDGTITALKLISYGSAGCGTGAGYAGPDISMYTCGSLHAEENDVFTNAGPASVVPPNGYPQGTFALEQLVDELAERLKIDPLDLRDRIDPHSVRRVERRFVRESAVWKSRSIPFDSRQGAVRRGVGVAQETWPHMIEMGSSAEVRIYKDGSIEVFSAVQDTGGGIRTVLAQVVAEEFGLAPDRIAVRIGDTSYPIGPSSGRATSTASLTPAVRDAAWQAKKKFLADIAEAFGTTTRDLGLIRGEIRSQSGRIQPIDFSHAAARMSVSEISARAERIQDYDPSRVESYGGVTVAEIEVDIETGRIRVRRVLAVLDCGRAINPAQIVSQVQSGVIRGISQTLFEQRLFDPNTGFMVNANLEQYKIAGVREVPEIEVKLVQAYAGQSSTDASGISGEAGAMAIGAAIANAFYSATGKRIRQTPMTPAQVLAVCCNPSMEAV